MPARERLATTVWDKALEVANRYPSDTDVRELASLAGDLHFGTELGLAYMNRGITSKRARELTREFERFQKRMGVQT